MDNKCEHEENNSDDSPDSLHFANEVSENPGFTSGLSEEVSDSIVSDTFPSEDYSLSVQNVRNEISSIPCDRNGEESDTEINEKIRSSENKETAKAAAENSQNARDCLFIKDKWIQNSEKKSNGQDINLSSIEEISSGNGKDTLDGDNKENPDADAELILLTDAIEKAIHQHLDTSGAVYGETVRIEDEKEDSVKEVSVQTARGNFFMSGNFCPVCKLQAQKKQNLSNLRALCLECPPYKRRKISNEFNASQSTSKSKIFVNEEYFEGHGCDLKQKCAPSGDRAVAKCNSENSVLRVPGALRVGLSKRVKLRPLHQQSKFQTTDSSRNAN